MKIIISSLLILISFFLGYFYSQNKNKIEKNPKQKNYVNLEILKTKIKITKNKNTIITVNGKIEKNEEIKLK